MMLDLVLLTEDRYERADSSFGQGSGSGSEFVRRLLHEETLLQSALERTGLRTARVSWSRPDFDWSTTRAALFRSTWDYSHRFGEFCTWLDRVERATRLINAAPLVRWNADKRYLLDLAARGVRVVPTRFVEVGSAARLPDLLEGLGWSEVVLKPAVSAAARETHRIDVARASELDAQFQALLTRESLLLQPFRREVLESGELSLVVLGGRFSHAVRKLARPGDFRVQDDHGGTTQTHSASAEEIRFAESVVAAAPAMPLYARVDCIETAEGPMLMELELIEPELFLRLQPAAAEELARLVGLAVREAGASRCGTSTPAAPSGPRAPSGPWPA